MCCAKGDVIWHDSDVFKSEISAIFDLTIYFCEKVEILGKKGRDVRVAMTTVIFDSTTFASHLKHGFSSKEPMIFSCPFSRVQIT